MHEMSIAMKILDDAKKLGSPKSITVTLGDVSGLTKEELVAAIATVSKVKVKVEMEEGRVKCLSCDYTGPPEIIHREHGSVLMCCPECQGRRLKILAGGEIKLKY